MKKFAILILLMVPFMTKATTYTSTTSGPWASVIWSPAGSPLSTDNVVIATSVSVTSNTSITTVTITVAGTLTLGTGTSLTVSGNFMDDGGTFTPAATATVTVGGGTSQTIGGTSASITFSNLTISPSAVASLALPITVTGTLSIAGGVFNCAQYTVTGGGNMSMGIGTTMLLGSPTNIGSTQFPTGYSASGISLGASSTVIYEALTTQTVSTTPSYQNLQIASTCSPPASSTLNIQGNLTVSPGGLLSEGSSTINLTGSATIQGALSFGTGSFNIKGNYSNSGLFTAGTGTVTFNGSSAQSLGGSDTTIFNNLTLNGGNTVTLGNNEDVSNTLTISSGTTLDVSSSSYNLSVGGNYTDNGTFTPRSGVFRMNGSANQTISAPSSTTFNTLLVNQGGTAQVLMSCPVTVTNLIINAGTLNCQANQLTGNASGTMTMASGAFLLLGSPSSGTAVAFPRFFITSNTLLSSASNVTYLAYMPSLQTVSDTPTYGNLVLATNNSVPASSPLTVAGGLTINSSTTLGGGVLTGTLNLGGNLTNNGTFTPSTGSLVNFYGSSGTQIIGGTAPNSSFYNFRTSGGAVVDLGAATTVSNNLSLAGTGGLDATLANNWNLTIGGKFTDSGTATFYPRSNIVNMNGSTLGGPSLLNLNKLVIGGSTTLAGNITTTSDITINSSSTFSAGGYNINIAGNFTDDGTFNCNTSTFDFDDNGKQCVSGTHTSETFKNLTIGPLSKLGTSCTVDIDGTIFIQPGGQMLCACH